MSQENIVNRILADAQKEAADILSAAEQRAREIVVAAEEKALAERRATEKEVAAKIKDLHERRAATARLDGAKTLLAAKRGVIDAVYAEALKRLLALNQEETLALSARLLEEYAEEGDVICLAENYMYASVLALLPVVRTKKLEISSVRVAIDGGFVLVGKTADKNLSYGALLAADRETYQAELAAKLF